MLSDVKKMTLPKEEIRPSLIKLFLEGKRPFPQIKSEIKNIVNKSMQCMTIYYGGDTPNDHTSDLVFNVCTFRPICTQYCQ